jgi:hypothetical protein
MPQLEKWPFMTAHNDHPHPIRQERQRRDAPAIQSCEGRRRRAIACPRPIPAETLRRSRTPVFALRLHLRVGGMLCASCLQWLGVAMRIRKAPVTVLSLLVGVAVAHAETKIFIVENQRDGYGVDQCLASGANCGKPIASAYCHSHKYDQALSFRKIDPDEITGAGGIEASCRSGACPQYVAIECTR